MCRYAWLIAVSPSVARCSELVVGLNIEAELGVCRCFAKEIRKALVEFVLSIACRIDIGNPNPLVGVRIPREVLPYGRIDAKCRLNVWWHNERFVENIRDLRCDLWHDLTLVDETSQSLLVGLRVPASGPSRSEPLCVPVFIDGFHCAIDPAEAERLLDSVVVGDPRFPRVRTLQ